VGLGKLGEVFRPVVGRCLAGFGWLLAGFGSESKISAPRGGYNMLHGAIGTTRGEAACRPAVARDAGKLSRGLRPLVTITMT
jgi:hypothetical protein